MRFEHAAYHQFHAAPMLGPTYENLANNNQKQIVINQTITGGDGDTAARMGYEVKKSTIDALTMTYPGMFTVVAQ